MLGFARPGRQLRPGRYGRRYGKGGRRRFTCCNFRRNSFLSDYCHPRRLLRRWLKRKARPAALAVAHQASERQQA
jgi:hypothetical protein